MLFAQAAYFIVIAAVGEETLVFLVLEFVFLELALIDQVILTLGGRLNLLVLIGLRLR